MLSISTRCTWACAFFGFFGGGVRLLKLTSSLAGGQASSAILRAQRQPLTLCGCHAETSNFFLFPAGSRAVAPAGYACKRRSKKQEPNARPFVEKSAASGSASKHGRTSLARFTAGPSRTLRLGEHPCSPRALKHALQPLGVTLHLSGTLMQASTTDAGHRLAMAYSSGSEPSW